MEKTTILAADFRDLISELNAARVEYLLLGGYAMAAHGFPRYTKDIDLFYNPTPENVVRVIHALHAFGYQSDELTAQSLLQAGQVHFFGVPPLRVDLLNFATGVQFADAYATRITIELDGIMVPVMSIDKLIENKRATGRLQDMADVEKLEATRERRPT